MTIYELKLFVVDDSPASQKIINRLQQILEEEFNGRFTLETYSVIDHPEMAQKHDIWVTPTVLKSSPEPAVRIIGDVSDKSKILGLLVMNRKNGDQ